MRIGLGLTLVLVIAVELTAAQEGLGAFLWTAGQTFSAKDMFSAFVVIGTLGWTLTYGLERIGRWLCLGSSGRALLCSYDVDPNLDEGGKHMSGNKLLLNGMLILGVSIWLGIVGSVSARSS